MLLTSLLLSRGSVSSLPSPSCLLTIETYFFCLSPHTNLIPHPSNICMCFLSLKGRKFLLLDMSPHCWRKIFSFSPFCPKFLTLGKGSLSLHSVATSELLSGKNEFLVFYCLIRWSVEVPICCIAGFGYASTARACWVMGWVLMSDFGGIACKMAVNWFFCGFTCRGSFCGSAMRMISKHHSCGAELLRMNAGSSEGMSRENF